MIHPGVQLQQNRYQVTRSLGTGGFADTWEIEDLNQNRTLKVLKVLRGNLDKAVELFKREAEVLRQLHHPGIPQVDQDGYFTEELTGETEVLHCLVMEKIEGENLKQWLERHRDRPITQEQALDWLKQLGEILALVHKQGLIHRDIKPSNIMLKSDGQLALIDFGAVKQIRETLSPNPATKIGTEEYQPEEQSKGEPVQQSDFYALGCTFVYLLTGKPPRDFYASSNPYQFNQDWRKYAPQIGQPLADLLDRLMARLATNRPENAQEILQNLSEIPIKLAQDEILEGIPKLMQPFVKRVFQGIFRRESSYWRSQFRIPKIALYGSSGVGKSSIINAILGKQKAEIHRYKETTLKHEIYKFPRQGWEINFIDSRGIGANDSSEASQAAIDYIVQQKVDIILFVIIADERGYKTQNIDFLGKVKNAHYKQYKSELPVILVLNKIDKIEPISDWSPPYNLKINSISQQPETAHHRKEQEIQVCIRIRLEEYQDLIHTFVPICAHWDKDDNRKYNIEELVLKIYKTIPDEAAKNGFGGATADGALKKALAGRYTSTISRFVGIAVLSPFFKHQEVLNTQKFLVQLIASISDYRNNSSDQLEYFMDQLNIEGTDIQGTALSKTVSIGEAAISYFIDKEDITKVQPKYETQEQQRKPEFQKAYKGGKREVLKQLRRIDEELHQRYGVRRLYESEETNDSEEEVQDLCAQTT